MHSAILVKVNYNLEVVLDYLQDLFKGASDALEQESASFRCLCLVELVNVYLVCGHRIVPASFTKLVIFCVCFSSVGASSMSIVTLALEMKLLLPSKSSLSC